MTKLHKTLILITIKTFWRSLDLNDAINRSDQFIELFNKEVKDHGTLEAIKRFKLYRLCITRYICGQPIYVTALKIGLTKEGFPTRLLFLKDYVDSDNTYKLRFVMTLLTLTRSVKCKGVLDTSAITDPYKGESDFSEFEDFYTEFVNDFKLTLEEPYFDRSMFYITNKAGPLGPALTTSLFHFFTYSGISINYLIQICNGITHWLIKAKDYRRELKPLYKDSFNLKLKNRKLSLVYDPEGKVRVIAIFDYITQCVLKLISDQLFTKLRNFSQDRTFTQDPYLPVNEGHLFHSLDLSSATDRFPIHIQGELIKHMLGRKYSYWWKRCMVGEPFLLKTNPSDVKSDYQSLVYSVGQPMGAQSSWAMFTISHHFIVQYCAKQLGKYPFVNYIMLGDDVVINDNDVAALYKKVMLNIGVDCSEQKSHVSKDTYEFAKRWFRGKREISGIQFNGIINNINNPMLVYQYIHELYKRNLTPDYFIHSVDVCLNFFRRHKIFCKRQRNLKSMLKDFYVMMNLETITYDDLRSSFCSWSKDTDYVIGNEKVIHDEMSRVLSIVLNGNLYHLLNKLKSYKNELWAYFSEKNLMTVDNYKDSPHFMAFQNSINNLSALAIRLIDGKTYDLSKAVELLTLTDPSAMSKGKRVSEITLANMAKLGRQVRAEMKFGVDNYINTRQRNAQVKHALMSLKLK